MIEFAFDREENILGKGKKCWLPAFFPFPKMFSSFSHFLKCFQIFSSLGLLKIRIVW